MANRIVTATVTGESIKLSEKSAGAAGSFNAVSLSFTFDSTWDGTTKKVYFFDTYGNNAVYVLLTTDLLIDGAYIVPIPAEPLAHAGEMTITIRGVELDGETAERIIMSASTTMKVLSAIAPDSDVLPVEPTPTQAEQLQAEIDNIIDEVAAIPTSVTACANSATAAASSAIAADASADAALVSQTAAEVAKTSTEATASAFDTHVASVTTAFDNNATAKTTAFNDNATAANTTIDGKVTAATNAATAAQSAQSASETARDSSVTAKNAAQTAQGLAETAKTGADTAKSGADSAKTAAQSAQTAAESARDTAVTAKNDAITAKTDAQTAQTAAELAETHAETAETNAETAETNATAKATLSESYAKGGTGTRSGEDTDNALYYKNQAAAIVGGDYPTKAEAFNVDNHVSGTTNKVYTSTEQTKLAGIAAGAEVNVNADWNAASGDAQILNKPSTMTPSSHTHGNITNAGAIGSTANLPVVTTTSGVLTTSTAQAMGGLLGDGYGTCTTAAATAAKVVTCSGFALVTGGYVAVKFTNTDTSTTPTLNVNSTGAKSIYYNGATITAGMINSALTACFVYNGTRFELLNPFPLKIGAAGSGENGDITSLTGLTTALSIAQGGTASTTEVMALAKLGNGYGTSSTAADTAAKDVTLANFALITGGVVGVAFTNVNSAASPTLNVNSTGAIAVYCNGSAATATQVPKKACFQYDGTYWQLLNPIGGAQIATGSYTGTGVYGSDNPTSFIFSFAPKLVFIRQNSAYGIFVTSSLTTSYVNRAYAGIDAGGAAIYSGYAKKSVDGLTIYWYNTSYASYQFNDTTTTTIVAIG